MIRINIVLLLAVVASAVYVVSVQYDSRRLFTELDKARAEAHRLETEYDRLQVEKRAQATPARVERLAREKLQMHQAMPAITTYVNYTPPTVMAAKTVAAQPAFKAQDGSAPVQAPTPVAGTDAGAPLVKPAASAAATASGASAGSVGPAGSTGSAPQGGNP